MPDNPPIAKMYFPEEYTQHRYSLIHFNFFLQYARVAAVEIEYVSGDSRVWVGPDNQLIWSCVINDQQVIFDYADHWNRDWKSSYPELPYFKFQKHHRSNAGTIALGPPMVGVKKKGSKGATLREYLNLRWNYNYSPGDAILCKQLPNGAALERRNTVHQMLHEHFDKVDTSADVDQMDFWNFHENCLAGVCVPGATNNMVDRGQIELIGLGVCTVSPRLDTLFTREQALVPGEHYVQCQDDYSDLVDILKKLEKTPELCKKIGDNARQFYDDAYSPWAYWRWIMENLHT